jgi:hypothetical protein
MDGHDLPGQRHHGCKYFCLDLNHDVHAIPALRAYADSCAHEYGALASDLRATANRLEAIYAANPAGVKIQGNPAGRSDVTSGT